MINEVIFDVETKKLFSDISGTNPADLGVSVVSVYTRSLDDNLQEVEGEIKSFWEDNFKNMWQLFQNADRIIGFNSKNFDIPALSPYTNFPFSKLPHFDLFEIVYNEVGRRIGLNALAEITLNVRKSGEGVQAVELWNKGDTKSLEKLRKYCELDVIITKDLYDFGIREKFLMYKDKWNNKRKVEIDFSHTHNKEVTPQQSLF